MQNAGKGRKALVIGIIAAVVVLAAVLGIVLTQCTGGQPTATTAATEATTGVETYTLYWNADRALYDGKSEAGMSSRMPESDGYFHVRFILDGQEVVLKVADRKLINAIDIKDIMGLEFDENGVVSGVIDLNDMPLEKTAWQFYVQSFGGKTLKANSSSSLNGMELLLEGDNSTLFMDMSGKEGPLGTQIKPIAGDRIYAISNLAGELTHVFVYERPTYMLSHEAECEHCKKVVTWYEWVREDSIPLTSGHYQLQVDVKTAKQSNTVEDAKICLDLNGYRIDGGYGARVYAMFNSGCELAIMDTSEAKTGTIAAHGTNGEAGMCVWVRYGAFYLYDGIMDASDASSKKNGTAVTLQKNTFMYMYGGEIIGGTSKYVYNEENKTYSNGMAGAMCLNGPCKFVMYDGVIRDGVAQGTVSAWNKDGTPKTYQRGAAGNIFMGSGSVLEMYGGVIKNGKATSSGGNIFMDGTSELIIDGGKIQGGQIQGKGKNGGSLFVSSKSKVYLKSGSITGGTTRNCGGNVYLNGTFIMSGGYIGGGVARNFTTGKVVEDAAHRNVFNVNGTFKMYGGTIAGGFQATDSSATDTKRAYVGLATYATIFEEGSARNLTLSLGAGGPVHVRVDNLRDSAKIGVHAITGIFTDPTIEGNVDNFVSDIEGAEVLYYNDCLALGRLQCICGSDEHFGACDGTEQLWAPHVTTTSLPNKDGYFYLLTDVNTTTNYLQSDSSIHTRLDLNGHSVLGPTGKGRTYSLFENLKTYDENGNYTTDVLDAAMKVTITDSVGTGKITMREHADLDQGALIWGRYPDSEINIYGGTFDGSAATSVRHNGVVITTAGDLNIYGGHFIGGNSVTGGIIAMSKAGAVFNMTGGTIEGGVAGGTSGGGNIYIAGGVTFNLSGGTIKGGQGRNGGNIYLAKNAIMNMTGGTVTEGRVDNSALAIDGGLGGNIYQSDSGTFTMTGGVIEKGYVRGGQKGGGHGGNLGYYGNVVLLGGVIRDGQSGSAGGNVATISSAATIVMDGVRLENGKANGQGGNFAMGVRNTKSVEIKGDTVITGGTAANGGNLAFRAGTTSALDTNIVISDVTISGGTATNYGGNLYMYNDTKADKAFSTNITLKGVTLEGGSCGAQGGNIFFEGRGQLVIEDSKLDAGSARQGGNLFVYGGQGAVVKNSQITNGVAVKSGDNANGGNIYIAGKCEMQLIGTTVADGLARGNTTGKYPTGGNIYLNSNAHMTMDENTVVSGGKTDQQAASWTAGGNVYIASGVLDINGATITSGEVKTNGSRQSHNIHICSAGTVNLNSGKIENTVDGVQSIYFEGGTLNIKGGQIVNTATGSRNIASKASVKGVVNMSGGEIVGGNTAGDSGANVYIPSTFVFNLSGGTVRDGVSTAASGGNFQVGSGGTLNITGGEIKDGQANNNAGNIVLSGTGVVNMSGGTVSGGRNNKSGSNGGSILISADSVFNMSGGTVTGGSTVNLGGNFYINGTLNLSGDAHITGGTKNGAANSTGNISCVNGTVNISGGVIDGDFGATNSTRAGATINLSGKVVINKGKVGGLYLANYEYDYPATVTVDGTLADGSLIVIKSSKDTVITSNAVAQENLQFFQPEIEGKQIVWLEQDRDINGDGTSDLHKLAFGLTYCICGVDSDDPADHLGDCGGKLLTWLPWNSADSLPITEGNWYLTKNVTLTTERTISTDGIINIDLNGKTVTTAKNMRVFRVYHKDIATTTHVGITDTSKEKTGKVVHTCGTSTLDGAIVWTTRDTHSFALYGGTLDASGVTSNTNATALKISRGVANIYGGTVIGGTTSVDTQNGAAVRINAPATMNIYGGSVTGGKGANQGGTIANYGVLNIYGGTVGGGQAKSGNAITVIRSAETDAATMTISGGEIIGSVRINNAVGSCDIALSGNVVLKDDVHGYGLYSSGIDKCAVDVSGLTEGSEIVVRSEGIFAEGANETIKGYFTPDDPTAQILLDGDKLFFGRESCLCGNLNGTCVSGACNGEKLRWIPWRNGSKVPSASGNYYLTCDVTAAGVTLADNTKLNLDLNGHTLTPNGRLYSTHNKTGIVLTITDNSAAQTGTVKAKGTASDQGVLWIKTGCTFNLIRGTLDGSGRTLTRNSGLVLCVNESGVANIYGGTIIGGTYQYTATTTSTPQGGTAVASTATINMYGGTIKGGTSDQMGTVYIAGGTFTMKGGSIEGGKAAKGGSVGIKGGTFKLQGGTISGGTATELGGNIYIEKGTFTMTGGTLTGGKGGTHGGNLYEAGGTVELLGGTIENGGVTSSADDSGGGNIAANATSGILTLNGVTVKNGSVSSRGGNIYLHGEGIDMTVKGNTTISGGTANYGGNISLYAADRMAGDQFRVTMEGGKITAGTGRANAGSVYIGENAHFVLSGGTVENGVAKGDGGNIYVLNKASATGMLTMNGGTISGGEAGKDNSNGRNGGNIYLGSNGIFNFVNGTISGGTSNNIAGSIQVSGVMTMSGGTIEGGSCPGVGGNIYMSGTLTMLDGSIIGGEAGKGSTTSQKNGGNVYVNTGADFTMKGGTISGGKSNNSGGNIHVLGVMTMSGGKIENGSCKNTSSRNIGVQGGILELRGGEVKGDVTVVNSNATMDSKIILSNTPVVSVGTYGLKVVKVGDTSKVPLITVSGSLTSGASIVISSEVADGVIGDATAGKYASFFSAQNEAKDVVKLDDGTLYLGKYGCVCGGVANTECAKAGHPKVKWTAWTDGTTTPGNSASGKSGNYYLTKSISTGSGNMHYPYAGEVNIDLNGYNIVGGSDRLFRLRNDSDSTPDYAFTLGIKNSRTGGGVISDANSKGSHGFLIWLVKDSHVVNLYSGILEGTGANTSENGGPVSISGGTFNMYGGEIRGATSTKNGGAVRVGGACKAFNMYGGTISGGKAANGGNIYIEEGGTANLIGGTVTGGNATTSGGNIAAYGTLNLKGATVEKGTATSTGGNIFLNNTGKLVMTKGLVTGGNAAGDAAKDHENIHCKFGTVELKGGQIDGYLFIQNFEAAASTIKISGNPKVTGAAKNLVLSWSKDAADSYDPLYPVIQLGKLEEGAKIGITSGTSLFATGSGATQDAKAFFVPDSTSKQVVLTDKGLEMANASEIWRCVCGGKAVGVGDHECVDVKWTETATWPTASGNYILTQSFTTEQKDYTTAGLKISLDLNGNTITAASQRVLRLASTVDFNITDSKGGGKIIGKGSTAQGGTVIMSAGSKLNLYAGTITSTKEKDTPTGGGVVYTTQTGTTFTMYGGEVSNGKSTGTGGNMLINSDSTFVMYAGKVENGTAKGANHANIHVKFSHAELYGGEIAGGVLVQNWNTDSSSIKIAGNPVIYSEDATAQLELVWSTDKSSPVNYPVIELGELTEGANIHITNTAVGRQIAKPDGSYVITNADAAYFTSVLANSQVALVDGLLKVVAK